MKIAIQEEASEAIEMLKQRSGNDVLIENNFNIAVFNILWRVAVNQRFEVNYHIQLHYKYTKIVLTI